jgi:hypothetical protein
MKENPELAMTCLAWSIHRWKNRDTAANIISA